MFALEAAAVLSALWERVNIFGFTSSVVIEIIKGFLLRKLYSKTPQLIASKELL